MSVITAAKRGLRGGVRVPGHKNTAKKDIIGIPPPAEVLIPLRDPYGYACTPTVQVGDSVRVGTPIGEPASDDAAPVFSSVSGEVVMIEAADAGDGSLPMVKILSDGMMTPIDAEEPPAPKTREQLLEAMRASGAAGCVTEHRPPHTLLGYQNGGEVDTLIINATEGDPYLTAIHREVLEHPGELAAGILKIKEILRMRRVFVALETYKHDAILALYERFASHADIDIVSLTDKYGMGGDVMLTLQIAGKVVPEGKRPTDVGVLVLSASSVLAVQRYLRTGMPVTTTCVTVDGDAVETPEVIRVPVGTRISDVVAVCGGYKGTPGKIILGGAITGTAVPDDSQPIPQNAGGVLLFSAALAERRRETACIRCGRCVAACPVGLRPLQLALTVKAGDRAALLRQGIRVCTECGACAYICPTSQPLLSAMLQGKALASSPEETPAETPADSTDLTAAAPTGDTPAVTTEPAAGTPANGFVIEENPVEEKPVEEVPADGFAIAPDALTEEATSGDAEPMTEPPADNPPEQTADTITDAPVEASPAHN